VHAVRRVKQPIARKINRYKDLEALLQPISRIKSLCNEAHARDSESKTSSTSRGLPRLAIRLSEVTDLRATTRCARQIRLAGANASPGRG
jgi:hypothetical protein